MALNTNLLAQTPDLAGSFVQGRQEARQNKLAEMQMMQQQQQFAQQQQDYEQTNAINKYLQSANLNTPEGMAGLNQFGLKGVTTGATLAKNKAEMNAAQNKSQLDKLGIMEKVTDQAGSLYSAVQQNPAAWPQARQQLVTMMAQFGGDSNSIPEQYDPKFVALEMQKALKVKDALADQRARETQQITMRGQNITENIGNERNRIAAGQLGVAKQRLQAEMATGNLTPETVDFIAETYRQTGTLPPLGMGPMAAAVRSKILTRAGELAMGGGQTAAQAATDVRTSKAENAGMTAGQRAVGTQIANVQVAANEANKMINVAKPYVDKVNPTDYPALNAAGNYVAKNTGDPNIVGLATSLNAIVNTYARAINPKGTATVSDKNHAREILNAAMSKGQLTEAFNVMNQEMGAALASGPETKAGMRAANAPAAPATTTNIDALLKKYQ